MPKKNSSGLISCRCTNCGAPLEIEAGQEFVTCSYCDTVLRIENASNRDRSDDIRLYSDTYYENPKGNGEYAKERAIDAEIQRQRVAEEAEAKRKRTPGYIIGHFFLWSLFYPAMLIAVMLKRSSQKKENKDLMANGFPPRKVTEFPVVYMIVCFFFFISSWGRAITENTAEYKSDSSQSSYVTSAPTETPTEAPAGKWYDKDIINIKNVPFSEETVIQTHNSFQYEIPKSWRYKENGNMKYYYPFDDSSKTFINVSVDTVSELDSNSFDLATKKDLYTELLDGYYRGMSKTDSFFNCEAVPCKLKDFTGMVVYGDFKNEEINAEGTVVVTVLGKGTQVLCVGVLKANDDENVSDDDYLAVLNSIQYLE